ncbi:T9SS type A sorting domain-containing protein [uncultured Lacinutrix sp.]|uniref:T9SS type A sorting domain-containing protein n=1 Tax=uncultured Lacinutrix sp. TaxID=574032 RepID=UPI00260C42FE|nr:T9SS type A sorting domain-containing protein [uncultured Lacinutrix sp.]
MKKLIFIQLFFIITFISSGQTPYDQILGLNADDKDRVIAMNDTATIMAIGSPNYSNNRGRVRVLEKVNGSWVPKGSILLGSGASGNNATIFGLAIAISNDGNHLVVGASAFKQVTSNRGKLYIYEFVNNDWVLRYTDLGSSNGRLGISVDISDNGDVVIAGAPTSVQGLGPIAKFYTRSGSTWTLRGLRNLGNNTAFGYTVASNGAGDLFAVGAPSYASNTGLVRTFSFNKSTGASAILQTINGSISNGSFGRSVTLSGDGNTLVVGTEIESANGLNNSGAAYLYQDTGTGFTLLHTIKGENEDDRLGYNTTTNNDGTYVVISAHGRDVGCGLNYGSFYSLIKTPTGYEQVGLPTIGDSPDNLCGLGMAMDASGSILAVSEFNDDTNGSNAGKVKLYTFVGNSPEITYSSPAVKSQLLSQSLLNVNGDSIIEENEASNYTGALNLSNLGLIDLTDLNNFPLVTNLEASNNSFTNLDLSLKNELSTVRIENTPSLTNIQFSTACIENIYLSGNNFQNLDLSSYTNLVDIDLSDNDLTTLDLRNGNNTQIETSIFNLTNNSNLTCVFVDNDTYSTQNWLNKDGQTFYVTTQQQCNTLSTVTYNIDEVKIYPNPTTNSLNIETSSVLKQITIYSVLGTKVLESTSKTIDVSNLKEGMYLIKIENEVGSIDTKRFIKQ